MSMLDKTQAPPLAMATIPKQEWCEPYDWGTALKEGTIFPCLNLTFFKAQDGDSNIQTSSNTSNKEQKNREEMMSRLSEISFALNDLTLYLDTHPDCQNGLALYHKLMKERLELLADFARNFYPVTQASAITGECDENIYGWGEGPAPWEGACL
ncbi:MAG: spore coat protein CotJB [Lachnospiraceae bacterium]|nr:spore coat protein CotJB [Lachnospiraceae bacterium]